MRVKTGGNRRSFDCALRAPLRMTLLRVEWLSGAGMAEEGLITLKWGALMG